MVFRYQPTRGPLNQLRDEMDRLFTNFMGTVGDGLRPAMFRSQPPVNVWEREDAVLVEMEAPGVKNHQVDVSVSGDELSIRINRPEAAEEGAAYHRRERPVGSFNRVLRLPVEVDANRVQAELREGVLLITLPKAESAKPRKINVASA
jgi:HSP20 family protein